MVLYLYEWVNLGKILYIKYLKISYLSDGLSCHHLQIPLKRRKNMPILKLEP